MKLLGLCGLLLDSRLVDDSHDVGFLHDKELLAIDLHLSTRPFAKQNALADFDVDGNELAGLIAAAWPNGNDLALRGLFLSGIWNNDAAG